VDALHFEIEDLRVGVHLAPHPVGLNALGKIDWFAQHRKSPRVE
jgi:hypothetical protein